MEDINHNVRVAESPMQGKGVFAARAFREGEEVLVIDDSHEVKDESELTEEQHAFDLDYLADKTIVMQPPEKYINHSCDPSVYTKTVDGVRRVFAMREIQAGEEITYDYSMNGDNEGTFICKCGSKKCRGVYKGNFFELTLERQKEYLPYLEKWFIAKHREEIDKIKEA